MKQKKKMLRKVDKLDIKGWITLEQIMVIGENIKEKTYFLLYLGKILSQQGKTIIITKNKSLIKDINPYEYIPNMYIYYISHDEFKIKEQYDFLIYEVENDKTHIDHEQEIYFITNSEKTTIEKNKKLLKDIYNKAEVRLPIEIIYINLYYDSKINEKYLTNYFQDVLNETEIVNSHKIPFNDIDAITNMENEYDNKLIIKTLSKEYKKVLYNVANQIMNIEPKKFKKLVKIAERSKH